MIILIRKIGGEFMIGDDIEVAVLDFQGNQVENGVSL